MNNLLTMSTAHLSGATVRIAPELILVGTIVLLLVVRMFLRRGTELHLGVVALAGCLAALIASIGLARHGAEPRKLELFQGMLAYDQFSVYFKIFLLFFTALVIWMSLLTGVPNREDAPDFFALLLGASLGMILMAEANHLLMIYLAIEMASVPSYALAGFFKTRRPSSEASLKYVVFGAGASGVMLYGISLMAGKYGTLHLPSLARVMAPAAGGFDPILLMALIFILVGFAFKISAVPFHFWCPDVFEGAPAEVAAFLSVASKGAALALLSRFAVTLGGAHSGLAGPHAGRMWQYLSPSIAFFAAITATFGNLAAYGQTNVKRLLAYSTIAHAGYMLMAIAPLDQRGVQALMFYLPVYLFMNLGAFAVVAIIRNRTGSEDLEVYRGLVYRSPLLAVCMSLFLLSLVGAPPLAGLIGKFLIFSALYNAGSQFYWLLVVGLANTVFSLWYYVKVIRVMVIDAPPEATPPLPARLMPGLFNVVMVLGVFGLFIWWGPLYRFAGSGAATVFQAFGPWS